MRQNWAESGVYTAISRKVVGKSARDHPERYFGWFCIHSSFSRKFERVAREVMDVCLRVLKESSKSRFDSYSVRNRVLIISHITFRGCRVHLFSDNLSRNSCILQVRRRNDRNFLINTEILQILTHFSYLILASHRPCHDVELTQL